MQDPNRRKARVLNWSFRTVAILFLRLLVLGMAAAAVLLHPATPLPDHWNPTRPFDPVAPVTVVTSYKLARISGNPQACLAALELAGLDYDVLEPVDRSEHCHIRNRVGFDRVGQARINRLETSCAVALRLVMWEHHALQPLSARLYGAPVDRIHHIGSYSCRKIRGSSTRWSEHSTANAVDITGFDIATGEELRLIKHWSSGDTRAEFLRGARDGGCQHFNITLSPDYNAAHADHYHFDLGRWRACR